MYQIRVMICGSLPKLDVHGASVLGFLCGQSTNSLRVRQGLALKALSLEREKDLV